MIIETKTTKDITIRVGSKYETSSSNPEKNYFAYSYHVCIENNSNETVKLLRRNWIITNGHRDIRKVAGIGVIGVQPIIYPGEKHEYSSWCPLSTPLGKMEGYYVLEKTSDNSHFKAIVPQFLLMADYIKN